MEHGLPGCVGVNRWVDKILETYAFLALKFLNNSDMKGLYHKGVTYCKGRGKYRWRLYHYIEVCCITKHSYFFFFLII